MPKSFYISTDRVCVFALLVCLLLVYTKGTLGNSGNNTKKLIEPKATIFLIKYKLEYVIDTTSIDAVSNHLFSLYAGSNNSVFQSSNMNRSPSERAFLRDSSKGEITGIDASVTRLTSPAPFFFCIEKNYERALICTYDRVFMDGYFFEESMNSLKWQITGNHKTFLGYKVQEATTTYGCRDWVAWFAPDIPISDGPYKFHGLPGLIVRVADTRNHYVFELEGIDRFDEDLESILDKSRRSNRVKTTLKEFVRLRDNFAHDAGTIVGMHTPDPEIRARASANAARRNNFIELCAD